jgi:hypothetical protein
MAWREIGLLMPELHRVLMLQMASCGAFSGRTDQSSDESATAPDLRLDVNMASLSGARTSDPGEQLRE